MYHMCLRQVGTYHHWLIMNIVILQLEVDHGRLCVKHFHERYTQNPFLDPYAGD